MASSANEGLTGKNASEFPVVIEKVSELMSATLEM